MSLPDGSVEGNVAGRTLEAAGKYQLVERRVRGVGMHGRCEGRS